MRMRSSVAASSLVTDMADGVLTLTLNRPDRRNAIDPELRDALAAALDDAATDRDVRGVVLTGAGGTFCAGGDLARFDELHDARAYRHVSHRLTDLVESVERLVKLLGLARAKEVLLGGEDLDAQAAHAAGLLSELAPGADELPAVARARVEKMLGRA